MKIWGSYRPGIQARRAAVHRALVEAGEAGMDLYEAIEKEWRNYANLGHDLDHVGLRVSGTGPGMREPRRWRPIRFCTCGFQAQDLVGLHGIL